MDEKFWPTIDALIGASEIIIDRPKGSSHPHRPLVIYPLDYGYFKGTQSYMRLNPLVHNPRGSKNPREGLISESKAVHGLSRCILKDFIANGIASPLKVAEGAFAIILASKFPLSPTKASLPQQSTKTA
ncbi:MAG: hypothetical protein A2Z14_15495 [Chloroflexi bacterium RBG_16_48_8]|nr:MAG: hypothetical protein A2Z14_15495 [Chloroflexi bacterium RBG_16_48_8]